MKTKGHKPFSISPDLIRRQFLDSAITAVGLTALGTLTAAAEGSNAQLAKVAYSAKHGKYAIVRDPKDSYKIFEAFLNAKDVDGVMSRYAPDAIFVGPGRKRYVGHDDIRSCLAGMIGDVKPVKFILTDLIVYGDTALERVKSTSATASSSGQRDNDELNSNVILRRQHSGNWLIVVDDSGM